MQRTPWSITMNKCRMIEKPPFGPGFSIDEAEKADSMSITFTDFKDLGEDYTVFALHDKDGKIIASKTIIGY